MNIKIKKLILTNFKCFREKEIQFNDDVTVVRGRNGVGKTTIADAILWCLFGKNSQGQSDFDLKTHGEDGKPIPNLDHSVEMVLRFTIEEPHTVLEANIVKEITLKRTLKETWIKKRGSDEQVFKNNTTEYTVNGDSYTAADYKKYIASIVSEDVFKCITNPSFFPSLKWQEQRKFLQDMVGTIVPEPIEHYSELEELLSRSGDDIIAYRKHLSYQIKQIKDKLDKIPVRLEEQNKALPEKLDWDALEEEHNKAVAELQAVESKILAIKSGGGDDVRKAELREEYNKATKEALAIQDKHRKAIQLMNIDRDKRMSEASKKFNSLLNTQHDLENQIRSFDTLIERCKETAEQTFKNEQAYVREHWKETQLEFNSEEAMCPYCHQYLPDEMVAKTREEFNKHKAELKEQLTSRANAAKQLLADAEKQASEYESKKLFAETSLAAVKEDINNAFAKKAKIEKEQLPTLEWTMRADKDYQKLAIHCEHLLEQIESASTTSEEDMKALEELESMKSQCKDKMNELSGQIATRSQYDKIIALIEGIQEERKDLVRQLSELERKEDVAARYQSRQNAILEERINERFSLVQWKMFRTVNNSGDPFVEPYCECYVNGVAYHDGLNQAARLNAGIDIIRVLCKHYQVSAPICIDNAEAVNNILPTVSQQIRLYVSQDDHLVLS